MKGQFYIASTQPCSRVYGPTQNKCQVTSSPKLDNKDTGSPPRKPSDVFTPKKCIIQFRH